MNLHRRLKERLRLVRVDLLQVIERLDDSLLDWSPKDGMRTIKGQLMEIAGTEVQLMTWIRQGRQISYEEAMGFGDEANTLEGCQRILASVRAETLATIDSLSEVELESPVPFPPNWFEALRMPEVPPSEAIRSLAQHEWYHVGQLVTYLWIRGDDPYSW